MINTCFPLTDEDVPENEYGQENEMGIKQGLAQSFTQCLI